MSKLFKASFPDRLVPESGVFNLYTSARTTELPTTMMIRATNKREAWSQLKLRYEFERIHIEEVSE
jgi:hypothetical protein